ncbi:hypothetical protein ENBRE01_0897 [Enteropsectra breve]|nr:hypothetical protein ENBRE01_0897 [Enteropsectra breve]
MMKIFNLSLIVSFVTRCVCFGSNDPRWIKHQAKHEEWVAHTRAAAERNSSQHAQSSNGTTDNGSNIDRTAGNLFGMMNNFTQGVSELFVEETLKNVEREGTEAEIQAARKTANVLRKAGNDVGNVMDELVTSVGGGSSKSSIAGGNVQGIINQNQHSFDRNPIEPASNNNTNGGNGPTAPAGGNVPPAPSGENVPPAPTGGNGPTAPAGGNGPNGNSDANNKKNDTVKKILIGTGIVSVIGVVIFVAVKVLRK